MCFQARDPIALNAPTNKKSPQFALVVLEKNFLKSNFLCKPMQNEAPFKYRVAVSDP